MKKLLILFANLFIAVNVFAAYPVDIKFEAIDADGKKIQQTVTIKSAPKRIVTLEIGALDNVDALGYGDKVVGTTPEDLPASLVKYRDSKKFTAVGDVKNINLEKVAALKPDLILLGFRSRDYYAAAKKIAPTIDVSFAYDNYVNGVFASAKLVAKALDKEKLADSKIAALKTKIAALKKRSQAENILLLMVTGKTVNTYPSQMPRFSFLYSTTNFKNAFTSNSTKIDKHGAAVSMETIAAINPEIIYVLDRGAAIGKVASGAAKPAKTVLDNKFIKSTQPFKNNKIIYVDGAAWYLGMHGLNNFADILDDVAKGIK